MFNPMNKTEKTNELDDSIATVFARMKDLTPDSPQYSATVDQLLKLYKLREETTSRKRVSPDAMAQVAGSLAGILLIITYERSHALTSKALGHIIKSIR